jgi:hypothetical protein
MKLFKRGLFRSQRGAIRSDQAPVEDLSIGSNLSEDDQFDILIPERSAFLLNGYGRDENSVISSLTLHERHYRTSSRSSQGSSRRKSPRVSKLGGCCYADTGGSTTASTAKTNDYSIANGGATQTAPLSTSSIFDFVCCSGPAPMDEHSKTVKRTLERDSVASLVPTNSLFDSVMSEEELENADEITVFTHKRRKPWKLKGLPRVPRVPWRRARQRA